MLDTGNNGAEDGVTFCQLGKGVMLLSSVRQTLPLSSAAQRTLDPMLVLGPPAAMALTVGELELQVLENPSIGLMAVPPQSLEEIRFVAPRHTRHVPTNNVVLCCGSSIHGA